MITGSQCAGPGGDRWPDSDHRSNAGQGIWLGGTMKITCLNTFDTADL